MKALYIVFHGFAPYNGISKKIGYQIKALKECGIEAKLCYLDIDDKGFHKRMVDSRVLDNFGQGTFAKIKKRICYTGLFHYVVNHNIYFLYIRSYHNANPFLIRFVKKLKRFGVKVVMEIPTYPYDKEYRNLPATDQIRLFFDKLFRKTQAKYLYRIATYSKDKQIFGTPTIQISNGIDFDAIKMKTEKRQHSNCLHLIGVAEIHFWHGYDRLILGLAEYYRQPQRPIDVSFDIVGYGSPEGIENLKNLITENHLEAHARFLGPKTGKELDKLFDENDMGIASLGRHRSGITNMKSLKNREYAARGIPFAYSEIDEDFDEMPYILKVPADETPVDINKIVQFYDSHQFEPAEIRGTIEKTLSWKVQMEKVIEAIINHQ